LIEYLQYIKQIKHLIFIHDIWIW